MSALGRAEQGRMKKRDRAMETQGHSPTDVSAGGTLPRPGEDRLALSRQANAPRFSGSFVPTLEECQAINNGLAGWEDLSRVVGPRYYPDEDVEDTLFQVLAGNLSISRGFIETVARAKTEVFNANALLQGVPPHPVDHFLADSKIFLLDLKVESDAVTHFLRERFDFTEEELALVHLFIAKTAPLLYNMGFPDAISHSAQVARLCAVQADRHGASRTELMQAVMVGWLHDPKLGSNLSWSNLAAHPAVASAISHQVLSSPDMAQMMQDWLSGLLNPPDARTFRRGVENALSINNDSMFILENVILHKPVSESIPNLEPGVGIAERLPGDIREELLRIARQRFASSSKAEGPEPLPAATQAALLETLFETGLKGIHLDAIQQVFELNSLEAAEALFRRMIRGEYPDARQVERLSHHLKETPEHLYSLPISALRLFSHHDEITVGRIPALALAMSDPLLLSPHKLLESAKQPTALERLQSFINSFGENIRFLPQPAYENGRHWQRDLLASILRAAESLTQKPLAHEFSEDTPLAEQIGWLESTLVKPETWISQDGMDYGALSPADQGFDILLRIMKEKYEAATHQSPALFGI